VGGGSPSRRTPDPFADLRSEDGPALVRIPTVVRDDAREGRARLVVLVPSLAPDRLTGGPNTALQLGARVALRGIPVTFSATHGPAADEAVLRGHVRTLLGGSAPDIDVTFESVAAPERPLRIAPGDAVMATWWPTAYAAARALEVAGGGSFLYLVQDFEPAFYPWSTSYALALGTYGLPMRPIFNTGLLRDHFVTNRIGRLAEPSAEASSIAFEPAVDTSLFRPGPAGPGGEPPRLLVYARPGKPRNAFELALRALRVAIQRGDFGPDWEFWSIGETVPELQLGRGALLRPMPWRSLPEYAALLGSSNVLLSLMLSPHTSYPPLEMAAAGGTVVTNAFGVKTAAALQRISPRIHAVEPDVNALADALAMAARMPRATEPATLALPTSWAASLEPVVDWILGVGFGDGAARPNG
jgi:hypothetical protein